MEFLVLGPIEVYSAGEQIPVGGTKQRSILALLIANQGRAVSTNRIAEDIYGEDAAGGSRRSVQSIISMMRRELGDVITGTGDGYVFHAPRQDVDASRFQDSVAAGLGMVDEQPEQASVLLSDALALWRGDPYGDVDGQAVFEPEIIRLGELRFTALEARIEADLGCGRHRQVVPELEALVVEYPLRERLWSLLMVALYRVGRQSDALRAYQQLGTVLGEELGIEPSNELRILEEQILLQDPDLDLVVPIPHNLPAQSTSFIGRELELIEIATLLTDTRLVTLTGTGGSGKTRLAVEAARQVLEDYSDGVWFVDFRGITDPIDVPSLIASTLRVVFAGDVPVADQLAAGLRSRQLLLILDNCEHLLDEVPLLVETLLRREGALRIVTTSRQPLGIPGETTIDVRPLTVPEGGGLDELSSSEAAVLFADRARTARPGFLLAEHAQSVAGICQAVEGLPLALELAAARLRVISPEELIEHLDNQMGILKTVQKAGDLRHATIEATIQWSWDLLDDDQQALLSRLSVFRGTWSLDAAESICGFAPIDHTQILDVVGGLVEKSQIVAESEVAGLTRYRLLEPIRQYAARQLRDTAMQELQHRLVDHWTAALAGSYDPETRFAWRDHKRARELEADQANITTAVEWALGSGRFEDAMMMFASPFGDLLLLQGSHFETSAGWVKTAVESWNATSPGVLLSALETAARISISAGHYDTARNYAETGIERSRTPEERRWYELTAAWAAKRMEGLSPATRAAFTRVAAEAEEPALRVSALLAEAFNRTIEEAWTLTQQAMELMPIDSPLLWDECEISVWFLDVADDSGHYDIATRFALRALDLARYFEWHSFVSFAAVRLACLYAARGRLGEAAALATDAMHEARRILGPSAIVANTHARASRIFRVNGDLEQAQQCVNEALTIMREIPQPWFAAYVTVELALIARDRGNLDQAEELLDNAAVELVRITHADFEPWIRSLVASALATVRLRRGHPRRALADLAPVLTGPQGPNHLETLEAVDLVSIALAQLGRIEQAARLKGAVDHERERTGLVIQPPDAPLREAATHYARSLFEGDWEAAVERGRSMTLEEAVELAVVAAASDSLIEHPVAPREGGELPTV